MLEVIYYVFSIYRNKPFYKDYYGIIKCYITFNKLIGTYSPYIKKITKSLHICRI